MTDPRSVELARRKLIRAASELSRMQDANATDRALCDLRRVLVKRALKEFSSETGQFYARVQDLRNAGSRQQLRTELTWAVGVLLGFNLPGGAAAVGVAYEELFPGETLPYMPPR